MLHENKTLKIGRNECDILVPDPRLSRHHASIVWRDNQHFLMQPLSDKNATNLLMGKRGEHYRPPLPLRSGDTIVAGRSQFKVAYQQRGNRKIGEISVCDELLQRAACISKKKCELNVKAGDAATTTPPFANMDPSLEDCTQASGFRDVPAMLQHFGMGTFGPGPVMILQSIAGPRAHRFYLCEPLETLIGSSSTAGVSVPNDRRMSDVHCRIYFDENKERWILEDMQSIHGTFVKVSACEPVLVCCGDVFVMGHTVVRILGQPEKCEHT